MCGRFTQRLTGAQIHALYRLQGPVLPLNLEPRYNGAPSQSFAACRFHVEGRREITKLRWGLIPHWRTALTGHCAALLFLHFTAEPAERP